MSWHCSLELVAEFSDRSCLDTESSVRLNSIRTAERSCFDDKKTRSYRHSLSGMTYDHSLASRGVDSWMSCLRDSRVSLGVLPANDKDKTTAETCGQTQCASFGRWDRKSHSWKTYPAFFSQTISVAFLGSWPRAGMTRDGTAFRLPSLVPISLGIACGSRPRVPRPLACDHKGSSRLRMERLQNLNLRDWWNVNYRFVYPPVRVSEYLMGFPIGWTDLKPLGMDRFQEWLSSHGKCSRLKNEVSYV